MTRRLLRGTNLLLMATTLLLAGCTTPKPAPPTTTASTPAPTITTSASAASRQGQGIFSVTGAQAQQIAVVVAFLDAYNAGQLQAALSAFAANAVVSDCDYRAAKNSDFHGRAEIAGWLRARIADHDHLTPAHLDNNNPDQPVGVIGIQYQRRTSDTLRSLGFPTGIRPNLATKAIFTADDHIQSFANGPFGGPPEPCRPA